MFTLYKLLWLRENRPDIWRAAAKFYCFEELIQRRLGVEPAISWPLAGRTMLFDVRTHAWRPEILSAVGLEASRLAPPVASGTVVGSIAPSVARQLGLPGNVQVVAGGHDQPCGALGGDRRAGPGDVRHRQRRVHLSRLRAADLQRIALPRQPLHLRLCRPRHVHHRGVQFDRRKPAPLVPRPVVRKWKSPKPPGPAAIPTI